MSLPSGPIRYEYDENGSLVKKIAPGNQEDVYEYDSENRLVQITEHQGKIETFGYDNNGNRLYQAVGTYWDPNQLELPKDKTNSGKGNGKGNENGSDNGNGKNKIQAFSFSFLDRSITLLTMSNGVGNGNGNSGNNGNAGGNGNGNGVNNGNSGNNGNGQGNGNGLNQKDNGKQLGPVKEKLQKEKGNRGKHLGWYKRADHPKNPGKLPLLNEPESYEIVNYVNDVSQENPQVLMTSDQAGTYRGVYTYGLERIAERDSASIEGVPNDPLYYLYDGHNSVTQLINSAGNVRDKYRYDAYGDPMPGGQLSPNTRLFNNPFGYNGEAHDLNSGLQYLRDRYYDPNMGRFMTRDSYLGNVMKPLSLNRYAYTGNNPVMYADPSGNFSVGELWQKTKQLAQNVADTVIQGANYLGEKLYEGAQVVKQEAVAFYDENIAPAFNKYVAPVIRGVQEKVSTVVQVTQATQANLNLAKDIMKNPTAYSDADFANMGPLGPTMKRLVKIKTFSCGDALAIGAQGLRSFSNGLGDSLNENLSFGLIKGKPLSTDNQKAYYTGKVTGDVLGVLQGFGETLVGGAGEAFGFTLDGTVVLSPAGVGLNVLSAGVVLHGYGIGTASGYNLSQDAKDMYNQFSSEGTGEVNPNGVFENASYHGKTNNSVKNKAPNNGQTALNNSVPLNSETTPRRIGVSDGEIVVLDQTTEGVFHGHVRSWSELTPKMRSVLQKAGLVDKKGNVIQK